MADDNGNGDGAGGNGDDDDGAAAPRAENLDALHEEIQSREELHKSEDDDEGDPKDDDEPPAGDDDAGAAEKKKDEGDDEDEEPEDDEPPAPTDKKDDEEQELTPPETDDDITKPGKYKAEFVDEEGNKYYVTSVKQLPDDFEPHSQKGYGAAIEELGDKRSLYKADVDKYNSDKAERDRTTAAKSLRESWNTDIDKLSGKDGLVLDDGSVLKLPEDATEREKAIKGTYSLMSAEYKNGKSLDSFAHAYELYQSREARKSVASKTDEDEEQKKNDAAEKKKLGNKVMSSGAAGAPKKSGTRQAPPIGTTLDTLHQSKVGSL
jgi:hypothetical protein